MPSYSIEGGWICEEHPGSYDEPPSCEPLCPVEEALAAIQAVNELRIVIENVRSLIPMDGSQYPIMPQELTKADCYAADAPPCAAPRHDALAGGRLSGDGVLPRDTVRATEQRPRHGFAGPCDLPWCTLTIATTNGEPHGPPTTRQYNRQEEHAVLLAEVRLEDRAPSGAARARLGCGLRHARPSPGDDTPSSEPEAHGSRHRTAPQDAFRAGVGRGDHGAAQHTAQGLEPGRDRHERLRLRDGPGGHYRADDAMLDIILTGLLTAVLVRPARRRLQRERYAYWVRAMKEFQAEITTLRDAFLSTAIAAGNFSRSIVVIKWGDPQ